MSNNNIEELDDFESQFEYMETIIREKLRIENSQISIGDLGFDPLFYKLELQFFLRCTNLETILTDDLFKDFFKNEITKKIKEEIFNKLNNEINDKTEISITKYPIIFRNERKTKWCLLSAYMYDIIDEYWNYSFEHDDLEVFLSRSKSFHWDVPPKIKICFDRFNKVRNRIIILKNWMILIQ